MNRRTFWAVFICAIALLVPIQARAEAPVTITFRNLGNAPAELLLENANDATVYHKALPRPALAVPPQQRDSYVVNGVFAGVNAVGVRYAMGNRVCRFMTSFVTTPSLLGNDVPKWTKHASGTGGAVCDANITSIDFGRTNAWSVEFTMK